VCNIDPFPVLSLSNRSIQADSAFQSSNCPISTDSVLDNFQPSNLRPILVLTTFNTQSPPDSVPENSQPSNWQAIFQIGSLFGAGMLGGLTGVGKPNVSNTSRLTAVGKPNVQNTRGALEWAKYTASRFREAIFFAGGSRLLL
jgi:hypothetical protein